MPAPVATAPTTNSKLGRRQRQRMRLLWALSILLVCLVLFVQAKASPDSFSHEFIEDIGATLIAVAVLGRTWCSLYIGGRKLHELVTNGPYSIVRNPLYVFSCIGAFGIGLGTASVVLAGVMALVAALVFQSVIRIEEDALQDRFGTAFTEYAARVPRLWPRPSLWIDAPTLSVSPNRVVRTFFDSAVMLLTIPALELVETLQQLHLLPVFLYLP
jgi:protein-S-isoprenylcysteine O-methyltransferase Ste14